MELVTTIAALVVAAIAVAFAFRPRARALPAAAAAAVPAPPLPKRPGPLDVAAPYKLVASRHGWMLVNPNDMYLGRAILDYGECCQTEVEFLLRLLALRSGDVVEIGANIGTHTVPMAKALAREGRRLTVFEPQPFIFQNLCANIALNGLHNVRAWPFACGERETMLHFAQPDYGSTGNFGGISMTPARAGGTVAVPCRTLDSIVAGDAIGLIKVDVEGFELRALQGAEATLDRCRPLLYVENDRIEESPALVEWLWAKNYRLWWHTPLLFNADNFFANPENCYEGTGSFNMLCVPREESLEVKDLFEVLTGTHPLAQRQAQLPGANS